ncbi:FAD-binding and (Fe-S)-binding domain-containing protein [Halorussus salinisoli]|uniref:FAD-binding and (Fe-S)-binding domain-containing protein n=1 Tax=Halorussus salinisoli TaxID=2558242 RepID=UPI0010C2326A|nr:FAD-binding and (Fe-S)-binding domain-containing protein [Halorussus salinisoli]
MSTDREAGRRSVPTDLRGLDGDADFDETARTLYATDASIYRVEPAGVVWPASVADVRRTVRFARNTGTSVVARGGGSSLNGNAIGEGIVLDCSRHFDEVVSVDPEEKTATVRPGVVLDELNDELAADDLYFPPDPSTSSTCTIGGMVANDAAGPHSVRHGTTRDNVARIECVLSDGTTEVFEHKAGEELDAELARDDRVGELYRAVTEIGTEHADEIEHRYPDVDRNSSGYDLESSVASDGSWTDLSNLLVGSEGTLGVVTEVTLELTERPETRAAALLFYDDVRSAADAVTGALDADPSAVELVDDAVLGHAREAWGIDLVPDEAGAALLVEVECDASEQDRRLDEAVAASTTEHTVAVERAATDKEQDRLWKVRKASNPLLNRHPGDEQALSFIEDAAIPPEKLPTYLDRVADVLADHGLDASVFGHAGQGVLHVKPFLNLQTEADRERLRSVSEAVHDVVLDVGGAVSGEHGDGRLRSEHLPEMYGETLYEAFQTVKRTIDPEDVFNPSKVVPDSEGDLARVDEALRYDDYDPHEVETTLDFGDERGFDSLIEQCNGCSKCRTTDGGVMCPSYRATGEEVASTRGRANALRDAIDGELGEEALTSAWFQEEVLDLCLSCKACETECPTGVDMAKLKTEAKHQKHREEGVPLRARLFGNVRALNRVGSALAPVANRLAKFGPGRVVAEKVLGIDRRRGLPEFASKSLFERMATHDPAPTAGEHGAVVLYPDCYATYNHPEVGMAVVRVLEALGYTVEIPDVNCCGRPALSQGMVETARTDAAENVETLRDRAEDVPVISLEPSCASALEEYDDLVADPGPVPDAADTVAGFLFDRVATGDLSIPEAPDFECADRSVAYHGHCHATARGRDHAPVGLLRQAGYDVTPVDATCCGMAGAFGYETDHYELSMDLGTDLAAKLDAVDADVIAAGGASCSQQLADCDVETRHPMELLAEVVA